MILLNKVQGSVVLSRIGMKFGMIVLQVNTRRLTESDFRFGVTPSRWRLTQKSAATW